MTYKVDLTPEDFQDLADCEQLVAIKESTDNISRVTDLRNAVGDRYQIFIGVDDLYFEGLALTADRAHVMRVVQKVLDSRPDVSAYL